MKRHVKIYCDYFHIGEQDKPLCEIAGCNHEINDIHHIYSRGMGGDPKAKQDRIENLIGLCRYHHDQAHGLAGDHQFDPAFLTEVHKINMQGRNLFT